MSKASPFVSSIYFAIKGIDLFCLIESLFGTSSGKFVRVIEAEPWAEEVCLGEDSGIVIGCLLSPTTFVLVSKEPEGLFTLKSFGTKCIPRIRSLRAILGKIIGMKGSGFESTL